MYVEDQKLLLWNRTYSQIRNDVEPEVVPTKEMVTPEYVVDIDEGLMYM